MDKCETAVDRVRAANAFKVYNLDILVALPCGLGSLARCSIHLIPLFSNNDNKKSPMNQLESPALIDTCPPPLPPLKVKRENDIARKNALTACAAYHSFLNTSYMPSEVLNSTAQKEQYSEQ